MYLFTDQIGSLHPHRSGSGETLLLRYIFQTTYSERQALHPPPFANSISGEGPACASWSGPGKDNSDVGMRRHEHSTCFRQFERRAAANVNYLGLVLKVCFDHEEFTTRLKDESKELLRMNVRNIDDNDVGLPMF